MFISIIIPIYNRANTLPYCLDSVLMQDFDDFECLLIDDGSSDSSYNICLDYQRKDSRFRVFHKENGGVGTARNLGLKNCKGEWVVFVDSDDVILPNHLTQFVNMIKHTKKTVDIVFCGCQYICNGIKTRDDHLYEAAEYYGNEEIKDFLVKTDVLQYMYICDRAYKTDVIVKNRISFDENLPLSEDRLFCYTYLRFVKGIATTVDATYLINEEDNNKLSKCYLPSNVCINRFRKLSSAMKELIITYNIFDSGIMPFWEYNYMLLFSMLHSLYNVKGNIFSAVKKQRDCFDRYFDFSFYDKIKDIPELSKFMNNSQARRILKRQFFKFNLGILFNYILNRFYIRRILKKLFC